MIQASDLKNGVTFKIQGKPYQVVKYFHQKIARGGGIVKLQVRNLKTHDLEEKTFSSTIKIEEISTLKKPLQFLYQDQGNAFFMDQQSYEQVEIPLSVLGEEIKFVKEGDIVNVLFWEDTALAVELPPKVTLKVKETAPGVKGNTASNMYKPATLENNISLKVPLFIKVGDKIRIDTRTGEYLERVN